MVLLTKEPTLFRYIKRTKKRPSQLLSSLIDLGTMQNYESSCQKSSPNYWKRTRSSTIFNMGLCLADLALPSC